MGHPDRRTLRERKRKAKQKEKMLGRRSALNVLDLTPHNATGKMRSSKFEIKFK